MVVWMAVLMVDWMADQMAVTMVSMVVQMDD